MRMTLYLENVAKGLYNTLIEELSEYAPCAVSKDGDEVVVRMCGDVVACECVVAICDKYRFSDCSTTYSTSQDSKMPP